MKKVYIMLNKRLGWKIIEDDGDFIDCVNPMITFDALNKAKQFCADNNLEIIRVCQ